MKFAGKLFRFRWTNWNASVDLIREWNDSRNYYVCTVHSHNENCVVSFLLFLVTGWMTIRMQMSITINHYTCVSMVGIFIAKTNVELAPISNTRRFLAVYNVTFSIFPFIHLNFEWFWMPMEIEIVPLNEFNRILYVPSIKLFLFLFAHNIQMKMSVVLLWMFNLLYEELWHAQYTLYKLIIRTNLQLLFFLWSLITELQSN